MTSRQLVRRLGQKLAARGVEKLVPDRDTLAAAYRRACRLVKVEEAIRQVDAAAAKKAMQIPAGLQKQVRARLAKIRRWRGTTSCGSWQAGAGLRGGRRGVLSTPPAGRKGHPRGLVAPGVGSVGIRENVMSPLSLVVSIMYTSPMTGTALRRLRRRLGLTQRQLAVHVGVHWNSVARWERDEVRITEPMARLLRMLATTAPTTKGGQRS